MNIPEEAVKAAEFALREADLDRFGPEKTYADYARAALSAAAPTLMAMAWDEGFSAAWQERDNPDPFVNDEWDAKTTNPYRKEQS